jgi:hypothetical protein
MKSIAIILACFVTLMLGACATTPAVPGQTPEQAAAAKVLAFATTVNKQCGVALPFLGSMTMLQTDPTALQTMQTVTNDANKICGVAASIVKPPLGVTATFDFASVQTFVNSEIPTLLGIVKASKLNDNEKLAAELGITGAQLAVSTAMANAQ